MSYLSRRPYPAVGRGGARPTGAPRPLQVCLLGDCLWFQSVGKLAEKTDIGIIVVVIGSEVPGARHPGSRLELRYFIPVPVPLALNFSRSFAAQAKPKGGRTCLADVAHCGRWRVTPVARFADAGCPEKGGTAWGLRICTFPRPNPPLTPRDYDTKRKKAPQVYMLRQQRNTSTNGAGYHILILRTTTYYTTPALSWLDRGA